MAATTATTAITRDATPREVNLVTLRNTLDKLTFRRAENQPINRVRDQMADGQTPLVAMRWGRGADLFHAVVVDRIEGDRVYFRNPHGGAWHGQPAGSTLDPPPRRVEGGNVESTRFEDFRTRLDSVSWQR